MARQRMGPTTALLGVLAMVLAACGPGTSERATAPERTEAPTAEATAPAPSPSSTRDPAGEPPTNPTTNPPTEAPPEAPAEAELGEPLALDALPALPAEGVAVALEEGLVLVGLDGTVHGHVPGVALAHPRSLQHTPAGLVPVAEEELGQGWLEPVSGELWPGYWGTPLRGEASVQLDPHAGSPDAHVIHLPDRSVAQWGRDDPWWVSAGHRTVTWEECPPEADAATPCPMRGHDRDLDVDLQPAPGCWVADTRADEERLLVCTDPEAEPRSWLELASPSVESRRYTLPRPADAPEDAPPTGHVLSAELGDGRILAQVSRECEVRAAALVDVDSGEVDGILGGDPLEHASLALGWVADGRAAVLLRDGPCAEDAETPGVWLVDPAGEERVYPLPAGTSAEAHLWRPVPGIDLAARASAGVEDER